MNIFNLLVLLLSLVFLLPLFHLYLLLAGSMMPRSTPPETDRRSRLAIAIPAHNEEDVIVQTISTLLHSNYPTDNFDIFVVADHCTDSTAKIAKEAGAITFERNEGKSGSKGYALSWLFDKIFSFSRKYDAVVIFDADSRVDSDFFVWINRYLQKGYHAIQGNHIIINPTDGWFPALTYAMFLIDNRFQNLGRDNLGFSAKNMGDGFCVSTRLIQDLGAGEGLTEDLDLRMRLILSGEIIHYAPEAKSYGQAPWSWKIAQKQRARWLKGNAEIRKRYFQKLLIKGLQYQKPSVLEATVSSIFPSYSSLSLLSVAILCLNIIFHRFISPIHLVYWGIYLTLLVIYPIWGLWLEKAPLKAYLVIFTGPVFMVWRTWLGIVSRLRPVVWIRTPHRKSLDKG